MSNLLTPNSKYIILYLLVFQIMTHCCMFLATKKRKKSRWGATDDKVLVTGPKTLPSSMSDEQRKNYLCEY